MSEPAGTRIAIWALLVGVLLITMALSGSTLKRLPLSGSMVYLLVGYCLGSGGWHLFDPNPYQDTLILKGIAEVALLFSLFSAGLKLQVPLADVRWRLSLRLAWIAMLITIALLTGLGLSLGMGIGAALLMGAILAPTDPVLASDVQVEDTNDRDRLRFSLTGESGLNDCTAFPVVLLALIVLDTDALPGVGTWLLRDVVWSMIGGLTVGALSGHVIARLALYLRTKQKVALGLDEFLVLGLIAIAYGSALLLQVSTFLSVFSAGVAMTLETDKGARANRLPLYPLERLSDLATTPEHAGPLMMRAVLGFNEQMERIVEVIVVIIVGAMIPFVTLELSVIIIALMLLFVVRPIAVVAALVGSNISRYQRTLIAWFGIRGTGSIYFLLYALDLPVPHDVKSSVLSIVLTTVSASIVIHGISVTPLMSLYNRRKKRRY